MLKVILMALAAIVVVLVIVVALRPSEYRVERTTIIAASPAAVFAHVNDLHKMQVWSPWAKLDPEARNTFDGPPAGIGAAFTWAGNKSVGEGRMTITDSRPGELVGMKLDFMKPFASTATTEFTFRPEGGHTAVTWSLAGRHSFIPKAVGLFMSVDKMIGDQFEKGLVNLKAVTEAAKGAGR